MQEETLAQPASPETFAKEWDLRGAAARAAFRGRVRPRSHGPGVELAIPKVAIARPEVRRSHGQHRAPRRCGVWLEQRLHHERGARLPKR